jgi:hypothetical protein
MDRRMTAQISERALPRARAILLLLALCALVSACRTEGNAEAGPVPAEVGSLVTAAEIDPTTNSPVDLRSVFTADDDVIYVVAEVRWVEEGVTFFARWTHEGEPLADSEPVTAEQRYENVYLEFHLRPVDGSRLEPGEYAVQVHVNGVPGPETNFSIQ